MELSSPKIKKFQEATFRARKIKKSTLKKFLCLGKWNFLAPSLKESYISGGHLQSLENKKFLSFHKKVL